MGRPTLVVYAASLAKRCSTKRRNRWLRAPATKPHQIYQRAPRQLRALFCVSGPRKLRYSVKPRWSARSPTSQCLRLYRSWICRIAGIDRDPEEQRGRDRPLCAARGVVRRCSPGSINCLVRGIEGQVYLVLVLVEITCLNPCRDLM